jgi:hypothetical protein
MSTEYQIPGGPYVNETGTAQRQIPGGPYINETVSSATVFIPIVGRGPGMALAGNGGGMAGNSIGSS